MTNMGQGISPVRALSWSLLALMAAALAACGGSFDDEFDDTGAGGEAESAGQGSVQAEASAFTPESCLFDAPRGAVVDCGYLTVPENRADPNTGTIDLEVAILRAGGGDALPDPILYLAGGPGSSGLDDFYVDPESWQDYPFAANRDLIFLDQRGTGYSQPTLNCPELDSTEFDDADDPEYEAAAACHDRLVSEGVDLSAYNSAQSAADVADLRTALGYAEWNLYGVSYGTRLALTVMRDHPQGVRSVVLDSTYPPSVDAPGEEAIWLYASLRVLFDGCAADPVCNGAYPDLENVFLDTVTRLNDRPELAVLVDPETGEEYEQEVTGDDFANTIIGGLNDAYVIVLLPRAIYDVAQGNYDAYSLVYGGEGASRVAGRQADEDVSDSEGMNYSVQCREEYTFGDFDAAQARASAEIPGQLLAATFDATALYFDVCDFWGAGRPDPIENQAVTSDIPTLILSGEYDPVTPPQWAQTAAQTLSHSTVFVFPGQGHSVTSDLGCATDIMAAFLDDPGVPPDGGCIASMTGPDWVLPGEPLAL